MFLHPAIDLRCFCSRAAVVFGLQQAEEKVESLFAVGWWNVFEEPEKKLSYRAGQKTAERRETRCRVALLSAACVGAVAREFAQHVVCRKFSRVLMTTMCMNGSFTTRNSRPTLWHTRHVSWEHRVRNCSWNLHDPVKLHSKINIRNEKNIVCGCWSPEKDAGVLSGC